MTNFGGRLLGVAAVSGTDAWAVGNGSATALHVLHWDGSSWAKVPVPGGGGLLSGVSADSASDVWAVGSDAKKTLTDHWDGTGWTRVPSPSYGVTSMYGSNLTGVSADSPSDAWAAGYYSKTGPAAEFQTLMLHWNGTKWARVTTPEPPNSTLYGVTSTSATDAWAVGEYSTSGGLGALLLHWDGTSWTQVSVPLPSGTFVSSLSGVSADSPTDAWAVGQYQNSTGGGPLLLHWNGTTWTQAAAPSPGDQLNGVTATSPSDAWATGDHSVKGVPETLILHWNGTAWAQDPTPNPGGANGDSLYAIGADGTADAWAVGTHQDSSTDYFNLILHWNGTAWTRS